MEYKKYKKKGQVMATGGIIGLIVVVAVATLMLIFTGVLSGQAYSLTESDIDAISNDTIKSYIKNAIASSFQAQQTTGQYLPLIVLAFVISIVMVLILGFASIGGGTGGARGGGAL